RIGAQKPGGWRYFPLATAHQGLLAGNRDAAAATIALHLDHEQMTGGRPGQGWYAFDEGGKSGPGNWGKLRTTWNPDVAMPHGWAVAEMHLLLRDALVHEDGDRLVLLAGVPDAWLTGDRPVKVRNLPTHFGPCSFTYERAFGVGATLTLSDNKAAPPGGYVLRLPAGMKATVTADGTPVKEPVPGEYLLPAGTK